MTTLTLSSKAKKEAITTDPRIFSVAFRKKRKSNIVVLYSAANYSKHFLITALILSTTGSTCVKKCGDRPFSSKYCHPFLLSPK